MSVLLNPVCPAGCGTANPAVDFDECAPELHYGEVAKLYVANATATAFTNVESLVEWTGRLSESLNITGNEIREMTIIGELPEPEQTELSISGDRTVVGFKSFTINFEIDETNDINYRWLMTLECNMKFKFWYETADGIMYGGNEGLEGTIRANQIIPRERTELAKFIGTAKWKSQMSPLRSVSPMA